MLRNWQIREAVAHTKIVCGFEDFKVDHNIMLYEWHRAEKWSYNSDSICVVQVIL